MASHVTVSATYDDIHSVVGAVRTLRDEGHDVTVFGPIMETDLEEALEKPASPVRRYALIGGITGCISGFAITIWSSYYYPLVVGGKPLASIPAYVVIGFEMTILFAGISALIGMLIHNRMPAMKLDPAFQPGFSDDEFGVHVACAPANSRSVEETLRSHGSREVRVD
jgi:hypothetical protein